MREADLVGALLLAARAGRRDPGVRHRRPQGPGLLRPGRLVPARLGARRGRASCCTCAAPTPRWSRAGALRRTPAWGSLLVSFFVGAALIAALIDIPLFARTTVYPDSQLMAALVLVRFLVALPVGAVRRRLPDPHAARRGGHRGRHGLRGRRLPAGWRLGPGQPRATRRRTSPLLLGGFGFGLALAPVNAALLASTDDDVHGLASALVVVARMVGMLVGISALTTIGLRRYYAEQADLPPAREVCDGESRCAEFTELLKVAGIAQEQTVFPARRCAPSSPACSRWSCSAAPRTRGVSTRRPAALGRLTLRCASP